MFSNHNDEQKSEVYMSKKLKFLLTLTLLISSSELLHAEEYVSCWTNKTASGRECCLVNRYNVDLSICEYFTSCTFKVCGTPKIGQPDWEKCNGDNLCRTADGI